MKGESIWYAPQRGLQWLVRGVLTAFVRVQVFPDPLKIGGDTPVCYVLPRPSVSNGAILDALTRSHGIPPSHAPLNAPALHERHAFFALHDDRSGVAASRLTRLVDAVISGTVTDVQLVPVSIFWGFAWCGNYHSANYCKLSLAPNPMAELPISGVQVLVWRR